MGIFIIIIAIVFIAGYFISKSNPEAAAQVEREVVSRAKNESFVKNVAGPYIKTKEKPMSQQIAESPLMGDNESYKDYILRTQPADDFSRLVYTNEDLIPYMNECVENIKRGLTFDEVKALQQELAEMIDSGTRLLPTLSREEKETLLSLKVSNHALNHVYVDVYRTQNNAMINIMNIKNV